MKLSVLRSWLMASTGVAVMVAGPAWAQQDSECARQLDQMQEELQQGNVPEQRRGDVQPQQRRDVGIGDGQAVRFGPCSDRSRVVRADDRGSLGCGDERRVEPCRVRHAATLRGRLRPVNSGLTALPPLPRMARDDGCPGRKPGLIGKPVRELLAIPALPPQR